MAKKPNPKTAILSKFTGKTPVKEGGKETSIKPRRKGPMNGKETGIPFGEQKQPSSEAKKAGWARRNRGIELVKNILSLKFKGAKDSDLRKKIAQYFGVPENDITVEDMMIFRQSEKAIKNADTNAFKAIMERGFGAPKQSIDFGDHGMDVHIKIGPVKKK
jgi:hypothetical protein